ncbi:MAG: drug resistance transporter, EmrB/QacA subfamily [Bryobacterales bacterium]|nr:drug resistance transporter, EmrB/QacA subfamily [Bryobacterales bacterium]
MSTTTAPSPAANAPVVNPWLVAMAVMCGTFMEVLDTTVVNVSLPHIAGSLSASTEEATWALTSYLVANAIVLPITGWLANFFGRKRLLTMSLIGFTVASFFCGFATTLPMLIVFRVIQGAAGGALQPLSQAVLLEAFPPEKRGKAMGVWGLGVVVAPILGPVLGGWLTDTYSWRWVCYINIPVGVLSVLMTKRYVFDPSYIKRASTGIDYWGISMLVVGIGALQIFLDKGQQEDWFASNWILGLAATALLTLVIFVMYELVIKNPVVDFRVFRDRTYSTGTVLMTLVGFVLYGSLVLMPLWLQILLGYSAYDAGVAMAPRGMGSFIAMPVVGTMIARFDPRKLLATGLFLGGATMFYLSRLSLAAGYWDFFWPQFVQGVSLGLLFVPLTTISMAGIMRERMGNATSMFNLLRNLGGGIGIAAVTTMQSRFAQTYINRLGSHVTAYDRGATGLTQGFSNLMQSRGSDPVTAAHQGYVMTFGVIAKQATILTYLQIYQVLAIVFWCMIPLVLLMRKPPKSSEPIVAH